MKVYLDNAATTAMAQEVVEAMVPIMRDCFGNPSSTHQKGRETRSKLEMARKQIAKFLNCSPGELFFTSGGTEADNMAIHCSVRDHGVRRIISSAVEHHAVLHTVDHLGAHGEVEVVHVKLDENGHVDLADLECLLAESDKKTLVSLMHANNEIGNLLPLQEVGQLCRKYEAFFHSDTVQSMAHYRFDLSNMEVDFITCAAHKFHGPKGTGFLYIRKGLAQEPFIHGGAQERNMRGGTENVYGIVGLAKAMELAYSDLDEHRKHVEGLKKRAIDGLSAGIEGVRFNGDSAHLERSLYTVLNVCLPENDASAMLLFNLDILGVCVSGGSACSSGSNVGSHVLTAIGSPAERPSVRLSFSRYNTPEEVDYAVEQIVRLYNE